MTVTLQDVQKILGLSIRGRPVTGHFRSDGWRGRVEAFLGREFPAAGPATRTSGVPISWLRQQFGHCPNDADEQTVSQYCRAWILHMFGCVLFPDSTGDISFSTPFYFLLRQLYTFLPSILLPTNTVLCTILQEMSHIGCTYLA